MPKADTGHTTLAHNGRTSPDIIPNPRRRGLLTGTIAAVLTGGAIATARAAPAAGDDAELLRLCSEMYRRYSVRMAIHEEAHALPPGITPQSEDQELRHNVADDEWFDAVREIADMPARTLIGVRAKAAVMLFLLDELVCCWKGDTLDDVAQGDVGQDEDRMALSLARDIMALEVVA